MTIDSISVQGDGYVFCKSKFYSVHDLLHENLSYDFIRGVNMLVGDIDSGNWAVSYLLSMYMHRPKDFVLFDKPAVVANGKPVAFAEISKLSCYMDELNPIFNTKLTPEKLVLRGLKHSHLNYTVNEIKEIFYLDDERFKRSIKSTGNEFFRMAAAVGFSYGKEVFCFPWLSQMRFRNFHGNISVLLEILEKLNKVVVVPLGSAT